MKKTVLIIVLITTMLFAEKVQFGVGPAFTASMPWFSHWGIGPTVQISQIMPNRLTWSFDYLFSIGDGGIKLDDSDNYTNHMHALQGNLGYTFMFKETKGLTVPAGIGGGWIIENVSSDTMQRTHSFTKFGVSPEFLMFKEKKRKIGFELDVEAIFSLSDRWLNDNKRFTVLKDFLVTPTINFYF